MDKFHKHRLDCPFSFAPLDVCDCVEKNLRDRIEADARRIERGVNAELLDQQQAMRERIAELEGKNENLLELSTEEYRRAETAEYELRQVKALVKELEDALRRVDRCLTFPCCTTIDARGYQLRIPTEEAVAFIVETVRAALEGDKTDGTP